MYELTIRTPSRTNVMRVLEAAMDSHIPLEEISLTGGGPNPPVKKSATGPALSTITRAPRKRKVGRKFTTAPTRERTTTKLLRMFQESNPRRKKIFRAMAASSKPVKTTELTAAAGENAGNLLRAMGTVCASHQLDLADVYKRILPAPDSADKQSSYMISDAFRGVVNNAPKD